MLTSQRLECGSIYTRGALRGMFGIEDATINNGIFRPRGHNSIWLFVTEKKSADRTQYMDKLEGDILYADGQTAGRTVCSSTENLTRALTEKLTTPA